MKTILKLTLAAAALLMIGGTNNASAQKFGYIDVQELVFAMPEMEDVRRNFETLQKDLETQYEELVVMFNKQRDEFTKNQATWAESVKQLKESELNALVQRIQEFEQNIQNEMQNKQNEMLEPLFVKANEAVNVVAKQNGLAAVFASGALVYIDETTMVNVLPLAKKHLGIKE